MYGAARAFFEPAGGGLVPALVTADRRREANALMSLSKSVTGVTGPAVGGVLVALVNPGAALAVDAATFLVSASSLAMMRIGRRPPARVRAPVWAEFREGLAEVRSRPWVSTMLAYYGLVQLTIWPAIFVLGPYVAKESLGGAGAWAAILTASAIGSVAGAAVALRRGAARPLWVSRRLMVLHALPIFLLALHATAFAVAAGMLVVWACIGWGETMWETLLQQHIPEHALSRVLALDWTCTMALNPVGFALIGPVAGAAGVRATLLAIAVFAVVLPLSTLAVPAVRDVRLGPPAAPTAGDVASAGP